MNCRLLVREKDFNEKIFVMGRNAGKMEISQYLVKQSFKLLVFLFSYTSHWRNREEFEYDRVFEMSWYSIHVQME